MSRLLHFEGRELKPYAQPVRTNQLELGGVYFFAHFLDGLLIPNFDTVVFVGTDLKPALFPAETEDGAEGIVYFQDVRSYWEGIRYESVTPDSPSSFYFGRGSEAGDVLEYERALDQLMECSLRRRKLLRDWSGSQPIRFEPRDLAPRPEPVAGGVLKEDGSPYFCITFVDDEMLIPVMKTIVFVGRDLEPGDARQLYFQDITSYRRGIRYGTAAKDDFATFHKRLEDQMSDIFGFEKALEEWMRCSLRRQKRPNSLRGAS